MSRRTLSMSPDVEEPAVLRALHVVREVDAWSRDGSNQASSGHVELSDSDMYDMENQIHEVARSGWPCPNLAKLGSLSPLSALCQGLWATVVRSYG